MENTWLKIIKDLGKICEYSRFFKIPVQMAQMLPHNNLLWPYCGLHRKTILCLNQVFKIKKKEITGIEGYFLTIFMS